MNEDNKVTLWITIAQIVAMFVSFFVDPSLGIILMLACVCHGLNDLKNKRGKKK